LNVYARSVQIEVRSPVVGFTVMVLSRARARRPGPVVGALPCLTASITDGFDPRCDVLEVSEP